MSDLSLIPLQDGYESQLSQDWDGNTGTVYVLATPSYTPTTTNTYIVVNPGKTNMQIAEITDYDSTAKTLTVSSISFEKGLGISSTAQSHSTGSKVIISDNYQFWEDIQTAVNSKVDGNSDDVGVYKFADATARDAFLTSPTNGLQAYLTTEGYWTDYVGGAWVQRATGAVSNASATVAGKVEIATSAESIAGTDTGGTGALLSALPSDIAKNTQSGTFVYGTDVGGDDTYVVALTPTLTTYTTGQTLYFTPTTANTGACSVNFGPSVLNIKTKDGNDPQSGVIRALTEVTGHYDGTNFVIDNEDFATTTNKGIVEKATDAEALAGTDTERYITPSQLPSSNSYPNTTATSTAYMTYQLMPTCGPTADAISNGWDETGAIITAPQGGGGYLQFRTSGGVDGTITTLLPGIGSNTYFRINDIGANAISIKTRMKFDTVDATEIMAFGMGDSPTDLYAVETSVSKAIRFVVCNGASDVLYAATGNGASHTKTDITGALTLTNWNTYELVITSTAALFYVNGTLATTTTTTLPTTGQFTFGWGIQENGSQPYIYISPVIISLPTS